MCNTLSYQTRNKTWTFVTHSLPWILDISCLPWYAQCLKRHFGTLYVTWQWFSEIWHPYLCQFDHIMWKLLNRLLLNFATKIALSYRPTNNKQLAPSGPEVLLPVEVLKPFNSSSSDCLSGIYVAISTHSLRSPVYHVDVWVLDVTRSGLNGDMWLQRTD